MSAKRDFIVVKGTVGQAEHLEENMNKLDRNKDVGFRARHYSVAENSGTVIVTVIKRAEGIFQVGCRTVNGTAHAGEDFKHIDEILSFDESETEKNVEVPIVMTEGWEPDEDFYLELYSVSDPAKRRLKGDDTRTAITILDEDSPGVLSFETRHLKVRRKDQKAFIKVIRTEGADCDVQCKVQTEMFSGVENQAKEFNDFFPLLKPLKFLKNQTEEVVEVDLIQVTERIENVRTQLKNTKDMQEEMRQSMKGESFY